MVKNNRLTISIIFLIMVMCLSLANVQSAFADDGVPPTDAPIATEEPIATETPAVIEEIIPPAEESLAEELLSEIPENTDLVILDENGDLVPLASQEALDIVEEADPIWCPAIVVSPTVGENGCTTSQTITSLLALMRTNAGGTFSQDGKIFLEKPGGAGFTTSLILDDTVGSLDTSFDTLKNFNLTIIGGWNGGANTTVTGESNFGNNAFIKIGTNSAGDTWVGNITIQDINVDDNTSATNPSVAVYTSNGSVTLNDVDVDNADNSNGINVVVSGTGNITMSGIDVTDGTDGSGLSITNTSGIISLNDVDVQDQEDGYTATITSTSGNVSITNGSSFVGNNNNLGFFASTSGSITITGTNANPITFTDAEGSGTGTNRNGATLSGSTVALTYVNASSNDLNGISISDATTVTLNNVTAENNGTNPSGPNNSLGSGVRVFGTGSTLVIVNSGVFRDNERYGIEVSNTLNNTIYVTANPDCGSNGNGNLNALGCTNVITTFDNTAPVVTYSLAGTAGSNGWYTSNVTVNWTVTDAQSGILTTCVPTVLSTETSGITATCTATNNAGLSTTVTTTSIKIDKTAPVTTVAVISGTAGSNGWYVSNVTVQTTGTETISTPVSCTANQAFTTETAGTLVSGTCTNNAGLSSNSSLTVKIDKTAPTLNLPANMTAEATSSTGATVSYSASGSDTISSPVTVSCSPAAGSLFGFGTTTVNCTGTNDAGLSVNGSFTVTVQDTTDPIVTVPANITTEATSASGATVNFSASATDIVDGALSATCLPASGSTFPLGTTTVNCSATDAHSNTGSNSFTITVQDTTDPIVTVPANITTEATSASGATVNFSASATDAVDGTLAATCTPTSGSTFAIGTTTVNCSATDANNNTGSNSFTVTVQDTTDPTVTVPANITTEATSASGATVNFSASATDAVDGALSATCTPTSGSTFAIGTTTVNCSATDANSNTGSNSFTVTVQDTTDPIVTVPANITTEATSASGATVNFSASATDIVDGALTTTCTPASGSTFAIGTTTVNCSATDANSNTGSNSFTITVQDTTDPIVTVPANIITEATSASGATVNFSASATDVVDGTLAATCTPASGATFPLGTTTVNCSATDANSNTGSNSFTITVQDTTDPIVTVPANITTEATSASGATVNFSASATDVVDGALSTTCTPASGSTFALGTTTVNCSATDAHSNTGSNSFTVTVQDTTDPIVTVPANITTEATSASGATVNFSASATDIVDGALTATCLPASGSTFPLGTTTVNCSATDANSNTGSNSFTVTVNLKNSSISRRVDGLAGGLIPVTGGSFEIICPPASFTQDFEGYTVTFTNLCGDFLGVIEPAISDGLPASLPTGKSFVNGLSVLVLKDSSLVEPLPDNGKITVKFDLPNGTKADKVAILFWDGKKWVEMKGNSTNNSYEVTVANGGMFILVQK